MENNESENLSNILPVSIENNLPNHLNNIDSTQETENRDIGNEPVNNASEDYSDDDEDIDSHSEYCDCAICGYSPYFWYNDYGSDNWDDSYNDYDNYFDSYYDHDYDEDSEEYWGTPLHTAIANDDIDKVQDILTSNLQDVDEVDSDNDTPLMAALLMGRFIIAKMLISEGADINAKQDLARSPLQRLCDVQRIDSIVFLLKQRVDVNYITSDTAIYHCLGDTDIERNIQKLLILHGADIHIQDKKILKKTPIELMSKEGKNFCLEVLKEIEIMKNFKLNCNFSLFDFLFMPQKMLARYVCNENIKSLAKDKFEKKFIHYGSAIKKQHQIGMEEKKLSDSCKATLRCLTNFDFPHLCYEEIFYYLSQKDMENVRESKKVLNELLTVRRSERIKKRKLVSEAKTSGASAAKKRRD